MARKSNNISVLQFDERLLSLLRVRGSQGGVEVLAYEQERGEWSASDGSLSEALTRFVKQHKVASDTVYSVLPRHDMTARILNLPTQDPGEIDGMVRLSAEEFVPYPADELVIDQSLLQRTGDGHARVLAVLAHRDVVGAHVELLKKAGIDPEQILVSSACLASAAIAGRKTTDECYALIDLASGGLEALVLRGRRLEYSRAIATGQDWQAAADESSDAFEELAIETRASLSAHRRESEDGLGVDKVYLSSDTIDVTEICGLLNNEVGNDCAPATFVDSVVKGGSQLLAGVPAVALGAALTGVGEAAVAIDLTPESVQRAREARTARMEVLKFAAVVVLILASLGAYYFVNVHQRSSYIEFLEARLAEMEPEADGVVEKQRQLEILKRQVDRTGTPIELLKAVMEAMPFEGVNLSRFNFQREEGIVLEGRSLSWSRAEQLPEDLRQIGRTTMDLFAKAQMGYNRESRERGETVYMFKINIPFPEKEGELEGTYDEPAEEDYY